MTAHEAFQKWWQTNATSFGPLIVDNPDVKKEGLKLAFLAAWTQALEAAALKAKSLCQCKDESIAKMIGGCLACDIAAALRPGEGA